MNNSIILMQCGVGILKSRLVGVLNVAPGKKSYLDLCLTAAVTFRCLTADKCKHASDNLAMNTCIEGKQVFSFGLKICKSSWGKVSQVCLVLLYLGVQALSPSNRGPQWDRKTQSGLGGDVKVWHTPQCRSVWVRLPPIREDHALPCSYEAPQVCLIPRVDFEF